MLTSLSTDRERTNLLPTHQRKNPIYNQFSRVTTGSHHHKIINHNNTPQGTPDNYKTCYYDDTSTSPLRNCQVTAQVEEMRETCIKYVRKVSLIFSTCSSPTSSGMGLRLPSVSITWNCTQSCYMPSGVRLRFPSVSRRTHRNHEESAA